MNITLFNREYTIRRFGEAKQVRGYITAGYTDIKVKMHVHPLGYNAVQALPEGERLVQRLEAQTSEALVVADHDSGVKGDLLWYRGRWYECTSFADYDHTLLSHGNYQFVVVPTDSSGCTDTDAPVDDGLEG
jgi:hypothetical protein